MTRLRGLALVLVVWVGLQPAAAGKPAEGRFESIPGPIRLLPTGDEPTGVGGLDTYFGEIRLEPASDGLVVVNRLLLERYLLGLQEVPVRWPEEALKAQAVAARTYALQVLEQEPAGVAALYGFDICASVECQVFAGADVVHAFNGDRWRHAVEETAGRTLLYDDEPILARYHSTSGGRTLSNRQVFTEEPAYPYLVGVPSTTETASPLYRWTVRFRLDRLEAILRAGGWWGTRKGHLVDVHSVPSRHGYHYPDVVLEGSRRRVVVTAEELRTALRELAPRFYPDHYPSRWATTSGFLPETLPSNRFEVHTSGGAAVVKGRGWGHGVGMSQWGANGMAEQGASYEDILHHYYTGVALGRRRTDFPVDVGLDWGRSEVAATGAFELIDGRGRTLVEEAVGTWSFGWLGAGGIGVEPPPGTGRPLRVGLVRAPRSMAAGATGEITIDLSRPARVAIVTHGRGDTDTLVLKPGRAGVSWVAPERPGRYRVAVRAAVGSLADESRAVTVRVTAPRARETPRPQGRVPDGGSEGPANALLIALIFAIILAVTLGAGRIRW